MQKCVLALPLAHCARASLATGCQQQSWQQPDAAMTIYGPKHWFGIGTRPNLLGLAHNQLGRGPNAFAKSFPHSSSPGVHFLVLGWLESLQKSFPRDGPSLCAHQAETAGTGMVAYFGGGMAREVTNNGNGLSTVFNGPKRQ